MELEPMGWFWRYEAQPPDPETGESSRPEPSKWWFTPHRLTPEVLHDRHASMVPAYADFSEEET